MLLGMEIFRTCGVSPTAASKPIEVKANTTTDTLTYRIFDNENDFSFFIAEDLGLSVSINDSATFRQELKDSLHLTLNREKRITIPKTYLSEFLDFSINSPDTEKIMVQMVDLESKAKVAKYTFDVNEGDHFFLKFDVSKGGGAAMQVEVLLNDIRVAGDMSLLRKKMFANDFIVSKSGKVDVVFRNFGFFRLRGEIEVAIKAKKEKIKYEQQKIIRSYQEDVNIIVKDTIYKTLFDESVVVSHSLNLKENPVFESQFGFSEDRQVLGFAVFLYPTNQKENLEFQRREIYREDVLQDFSLKELIGKSYIYLPEFTFLDMDFSIFDFDRKDFWRNGQIQSVSSWKLSANSKMNYVFFGIKDNLNKNKIHIKLTNNSILYDQELNLQVIALFVESFSVTESVEVQEFDEIIILSLL
jgi:hypothetical protein